MGKTKRLCPGYLSGEARGNASEICGAAGQKQTHLPQPQSPESHGGFPVRKICFELGRIKIRGEWSGSVPCDLITEEKEGLVMDEFMAAAVDEARKGQAEGGIPIGSVLVIDGRIVGRGHNRRVQQGSAVLHAEMDCLENAGRLKASEYRRATLYSTLSPCDMCSGAVLLYGIPKVVIGENRTFTGPEVYMQSRGVEVVVEDNADCRHLMEEFINENPALWNEDIGEA